MAVNKARFKAVVDESRDRRTKTRRLVADRRWREAEPDAERLRGYVSRMAAMTTSRGAEAVQGDTNDLEAAWYLVAGARARRAVAYVEANNGGRWEAGTGFLVSPSLFLTNQHVIDDASVARATQITFDREADDTGRVGAGTVYTLDPDRFALFSPEAELDYALVALGARVSGAADPAELGFCVLSNQGDKHAIGMNVNIIQHPLGFPKMVAVRNNLLTARTARTLLYETDTDHGSSGAPVFNDAWELVALHHYGEPFLEKRDEDGRPIPINVNEGVRISALYRDLETRLAALPPGAQALLAEALAFDKRPTGGGARRLSPPRPGGPSESGPPRSAPIVDTGGPMAERSDSSELRFTVPLEITVRVGGAIPGGATIAAATAGAPDAPAAAKTLARGAEKIVIDEDYGNREGYDPKFVPGVTLSLPVPNAKLAKQVAPLRAGEPDAQGGELRYQHFSVKMHKGKRIALFTATNIDGKRYLAVDRETGQVGGAEGERWFKDPRISASFFIDQTFYSGWSHLFDRGHLTRRTDPTWGSEAEAERANADTYHFTNCSPQHFRFNQTTKFWQGVERYVLENGAVAEESKNRISVFQGPIFDDAVDLWADDVQIPSSFFKVVVWKGKTGLRSVGMVVDQLALLGEERRGLKQAGPGPTNVAQWRVAIKEIERRTGLDFGDAVRGADTIALEQQPQVGEAKVMVRAMTDLLPAGV